MFHIETKKLFFLQEYIDCVPKIVPIITERETLVNYTQLLALGKYGASVDYLVGGSGAVFNKTPTGKALQQEYERRTAKQFARSLDAVLRRNAIAKANDFAELEYELY